MSVPTFLKAGFAVLAIPGGLFAAPSAASAAKPSPHPVHGSQTHASSSFDGGNVACYDETRKDTYPYNGDDAWAATCDVYSGSTYSVTVCATPAGGQYRRYGDEVGPGQGYDFGGECMSRTDRLVPPYWYTE